MAGDRARRRVRRARVAGPLPPPFAYPGLARALAGRRDDPRLRLDGARLHQQRRPQHAGDRRARLLARSPCSRSPVYGTEAWISRGEGFSVYFNLFSRISPVDGQRRTARPAAPAVGARRGSSRCPGTVALLVVMLGTVTFDGASEGRCGPTSRRTTGPLRRPRLRPRHRAGARLHGRDADRRWR